MNNNKNDGYVNKLGFFRVQTLARFTSKSESTSLILCSYLLAGLGLGFTSLPSYSEEKDQSSFSTSGALLVDYDYANPYFQTNSTDPLTDSEQDLSAIELRAARYTLRYNPSENWRTKLQLRYSSEHTSSDGFDLGDAFIRYDGFKQLEFSIGNIKEPFGLEFQTGLTQLTAIERSIPTSVFSPGRNPGILIATDKKNFNWALGYFVEEDLFEESDEQSVNEGKQTSALTGKLSYRFKLGKNQRLLIGSSLSQRNLDGQLYQLKDRSELNSADNVLRSPRFYVDQSQLIGLEGAYTMDGLKVSTEYIMNSLTQIEGSNVSFNGFYIQGSYLIGQSTYSIKKGEVKSKLNPGDWEVTARYSNLDLQEEFSTATFSGEIGSHSENITLGANYIYSDQLKFMTNLIAANIAGTSVSSESNGLAVSLRVQYKM